MQLYAVSNYGLNHFWKEMQILNVKESEELAETTFLVGDATACIEMFTQEQVPL